MAEADGGAGLGFLEHLVVVEELSRVSASVGMSYAAHSNLCVHNLWANGTDQQRRRWLPALLSGEHVGALAMSEADAGSDVIGSMACRAERADGGWVANGSKMWITNGPEADVLMVYMRTATDRPGVVVGHGVRDRARHGRVQRVAEDGQARDAGLADVGDRLLGLPHPRRPRARRGGRGGYAVLMSGLDSERLVLSGGPIGIMQAAMDLVLPYVRERRQFGKPIGSFELMQGKLADMYVVARVRARVRVRRRRLGSTVSPRSSRRRPPRRACCSRRSERCRSRSRRSRASAAPGYLNEVPAGRLLRDAKLYTIGAGTAEIRRMLIGRALTGGSRTRERR